MQPSPPVAPLPPASQQVDEPARRRFLVPAVVVGVVAVLLPVLWLTGGLDQTPQQPERSPGQAVDAGKFTVTVHEARIQTAKTISDRKPERYVVVRVRVVNNDKETVSLGVGGLRDGIAARTKAGKWVPPDDVNGTATGGKVNAVEPGLPVEASVMWRMGPADAPTTFTVGVLTWEYGTGFTDNEYKWRVVDKSGGKLAGLLTLPVAGP
ncbi:hypothetical protein [Actinomadura rudentiformis]|uniref:DUF4352 domain-containing protein n=1 Tax=Actinomadura rudentiformis TaxID=359158 RepID=A0A6H9YR68_9ACTN|nr:hypothetical protein [Actinomadura rudentiformis]KAB2347811.1 hypothetical protein F8566_18130 [Actinomadura rudentiformis]